MVPGARDRAPLFGVPRTLKEHASSHSTARGKEIDTRLTGERSPITSVPMAPQPGTARRRPFPKAASCRSSHPSRGRWAPEAHARGPARRWSGWVGKWQKLSG
jgi:hypothetical protein